MFRTWETDITEEPVSTIKLRNLTFSPAQFANVRKITGVGTIFLGSCEVFEVYPFHPGIKC